jgi:hypothetical protein
MFHNNDKEQERMQYPKSTVWARSNPVENDSAICEHATLTLYGRQFATLRKEDDMAAQPVPLPNEPPVEIKALIDAHINGFNTHDNDLFLGVFGDTAIIIDGIAPYRWLNPNAPANWLADVEKWRKNLGVTKEHLAYQMGFWNVEDSSAYAVISGTLTITIKNQSVVRTGTLAYTFANRDGVWKIEAQAWGRTS